MKERRKFPRIKVSFPIECTSVPEKNYFYTVSKDLSLSGTKILANNFVPKGDLVKLSINLIDKIVNVKAKAVWCSRERASERHSVGLAFLEPSLENEKDLGQFLRSI